MKRQHAGRLTECRLESTVRMSSPLHLQRMTRGRSLHMFAPCAAGPGDRTGTCQTLGLNNWDRMSIVIYTIIYE